MGRLYDPKRHSLAYDPPVNGRERGPKSRTQTRCPFHGMKVGDRFFYPVNPMRNADKPRRCILLSRRALGQAVTSRRAKVKGERYRITAGEYGWWVERLEDAPRRRRKAPAGHKWVKRSMFERISPMID